MFDGKRRETPSDSGIFIMKKRLVFVGIGFRCKGEGNILMNKGRYQIDGSGIASESGVC